MDGAAVDLYMYIIACRCGLNLVVGSQSTILAAIFSGYTAYIIQGQIGVLPSQFKNIKVGQQVSTTVTRYTQIFQFHVIMMLILF